MKEPSKWRGRPLVGALPELLRHPGEFCALVARRHPGEIVRIPTGTASMLLLTEPEQLEHVLIHNADNYWKGKIFNTLRPIFGDGLLLSEGAEWRHHRRTLQPAFHLQALRSRREEMAEIIGSVVDGWRAGQLIDVERDMRRITMRIILRLMFSDSLGAGAIARVETAFESMLGRAPLALFSWFLPPAGKTLLRGPATALDREIYALIAERRRSDGWPDDLLTLLLHARDRAGAPLSTRVIRDHLVTTIFGGYEATATALYWMWILLDRHPEVLGRLHEEIDSGGDPEQLAYGRLVVNETLRLFPPFWGSFRTAHADDEICGYRIRAGDSILLSLYAMHRDPRFWSHPDSFDPERFVRGEPRHRHAYLPFLLGTRACIGKNMAMLEMLLVAQYIGERWHLQLSRRDWLLASRATGSVRPRGAPRMVVMSRTRSAGVGRGSMVPEAWNIDGNLLGRTADAARPVVHSTGRGTPPEQLEPPPSPE
jgi:cytochrome P450